MVYISDMPDIESLTLLECKIDHWCIESDH